MSRPPAPGGRDPEAGVTLTEVLVALVLAHAGAALWHHFVQRDATLARMLPRRGSGTADRPAPSPSPDLPPEDSR